MKVLFAGGGTMGSVSPLVSIYEGLKKREDNLEILWIATKDGPERKFLEVNKIPFESITCGKVRRYFSLANIIVPFLVFLGYRQSKKIIKKFQPDVVLTAGSFIAVPVVYAAWRKKIPRFIHQQDIVKGLANKLMERVASAITVTFNDSLSDFSHKKTFHIGNPVRAEVYTGSKEKAIEKFNLNQDLKTILVLGGGLGAKIINDTLLDSIGEIVKEYQIIHLTGKGKKIDQHFIDYYPRKIVKLIEARYRSYEFLNQEIFDAYAIADLVVSRAGLSTLTELAVLAKPTILIPIPGHQEQNAKYFQKYNAVKVIEQSQFNKDIFLEVILELAANKADLQTLSRNISQLIDKEASKRYVDLIYKFVK